jgi:hypothetical protein
MKGSKIILIALVVNVLLISCLKDEDYSKNIVGEWNLDRNISKTTLLGISLTLDDENLGVYTFGKDGLGTDYADEGFKWSTEKRTLTIKQNDSAIKFRIITISAKELVLEFSSDAGSIAGVYKRMEFSRQ